MPQTNLHDRAILVVEDEYMLADDLATELADQGAVVVGPAGTVEQAMTLLRDTAQIHGAVLDVNLRGEAVFPLADAMVARGLPFVFTTGYDRAAIPERFADVVRCEKPVRITELVQAIGRAARD